MCPCIKIDMYTWKSANLQICAYANVCCMMCMRVYARTYVGTYRRTYERIYVLCIKVSTYLSVYATTHQSIYGSLYRSIYVSLHLCLSQNWILSQTETETSMNLMWLEYIHIQIRLKTILASVDHSFSNTTLSEKSNHWYHTKRPI